MNMTLKTVVIGSILVLAAVVFVAVILPYADTNKTTPSEIFRKRSPAEAAGRAFYIANGCVYCHSQSIRKVDWGLGAERIAQADGLETVLHTFQVLCPAERMPAVCRDHLIDAVAEQKAPIKHRDLGLVGADKFTVQIDLERWRCHIIRTRDGRCRRHYARGHPRRFPAD